MFRVRIKKLGMRQQGSQTLKEQHHPQKPLRKLSTINGCLIKDPPPIGVYLLNPKKGDSKNPYTRVKIVISGKYGIVNIDIIIKSGEPLT